ncbi:20-hydroxyecdysone protein [Drosophila gunungcola]|uniref:20-hydroxyecdysone protein n=1 Tax=Drosophila gunungcola TaxID=103775 RepID=A0A9P9YLW1_9MUSC|nr:20-hydroxyecdysone protein [Drosophila gunungcola]KAI8039417.1 hypothetical protein M5D96_008141 [Drosophila gunungcola]
MKSFYLILAFLAVSQGRVLNIPVAIVEDQAKPVALPLVKEDIKPEEIKVVVQEEKAKDLKEEIKPEVKPEIKEEIKPEIKEEIKTEVETEIKEQTKPEIKEEIKPEIKEELKEQIKPEIKDAVKPVINEELKEQIEEQIKQQIKEKPLELKEKSLEIVKEQPEEIKQQTSEVKEQAAPTVLKEAIPEQEEIQDAAQPQVRQATQATPTQQSTTQGNFVQQLIQNSPIGQFLNQFQPQPANNPAPPAAAVVPLQTQADEVATPAPTVPGFLNPQAAITSAQQAVQNAAQSAVNATTQAFQGIQQFASNLGNQFQNTLSSLTGQQQAAVATTPRPPGPIQQFVNNVFGGNSNATAAAAPAAQQSGNPLQGIINFLGGNRPQNAPPASPATQAPEKPAVDDKIDPAKDEVQEFVPETDNEIRSSGEAIDDSFEEAGVPSNEVIVVNDDAGDVVDPVPNQPLTNDAVAL